MLNKFKRLIHFALASAFLILPLKSIAENCASPCTIPCKTPCSLPFDGYYLGLGFGPEYATINQKSPLIFQPGNFNLVNTTLQSARGGFVSFYAGVDKNLTFCAPFDQEYYLGGEVNYDISSTKYKLRNDEFIHSNFNRARYYLRRTIGVSILPGIYTSECTLLYGRIGYTNRSFKISTTEITIPNIRRNMSGVRFGLGVRQSILECFAIRAEYSQAFYKRIGNVFGFDPSGRTTTKLTNFKVDAGKFELGIIYLF